MKKTDVLVIGSSAAGLVAATTAKRINPGKSVTVVTQQPKTMVPCGIPYVFGSVGSTDKNILPDAKMFGAMNIEEIFDTVLSIDPENNSVTLQNSEPIQYDKLVLGTGSLPYKPGWLKGSDLKNVFYVLKDKKYLDAMQKELEKFNKIVTIGAGFIGVEMSDELVKAGKDVTLVEKLPTILGLAFDEDICTKAETILAERGVKIFTNSAAKEIKGTDQVEGLLLGNGEVLEADAIILSMGYKPNTTLAAEAGLAVSDNGFICVDEYMRTEDKDIFAVGDCAEKHDFVTRKSSPTMLASTACAEARIAGMNLFGLSAIKTFSGTISIFATAIGNTGFGVAGLTETLARAEGFDIVTGAFEGMDRHPGSLADMHKQFVKLIVGKESGVILGGEVCGGLSTGELTNTIGMIIQNRMTINSLLISQIGSHPLLTASPAGYPLIKAAEAAYSNLRK